MKGDAPSTVSAHIVNGSMSGNLHPVAGVHVRIVTTRRDADILVAMQTVSLRVVSTQEATQAGFPHIAHLQCNCHMSPVLINQLSPCNQIYQRETLLNHCWKGVTCWLPIGPFLAANDTFCLRIENRDALVRFPDLETLIERCCRKAQTGWHFMLWTYLYNCNRYNLGDANAMGPNAPPSGSASSSQWTPVMPQLGNATSGHPSRSKCPSCKRTWPLPEPHGGICPHCGVDVDMSYW